MTPQNEQDCFYGNYGKWDPVEYVDFNLYDLYNRQGTINVQIRDLKKNGDNIKIHPDFNYPQWPQWDVALIVLDEPITSIQPVSINENPDTPSPGDTLFTSGWGAIKDTNFGDDDNYDNAYPSIPYYIETNYLTNEECEGGQEGQDDWFGWGAGEITEDLLCKLGDEVPDDQAWNSTYNRKATCYGDSGMCLWEGKMFATLLHLT